MQQGAGNTPNMDDALVAEERDSVVDDTPPLPGDRPFIVRIGTKFAKGQVHRRIRRIFDDFFEGVWPTYKTIPVDVIHNIFKCLNTYYQWNPANDGTIREAFEFVLANRYSDIMSTYRKDSARSARLAGHPNVTDKDFSVIRNYPPHLIDGEQWQKLCDECWNTPAWLKKSALGKANRASGDKSGKVSRHTGGSMENDEHRLQLEKKLGIGPTLEQLYCDTHLTKKDKEKYWAKEYDDIEELDFCTSTAKEVLVSYKRGMCEKYGEDQSQHPGDDPEVYKSTQEGRGPGWRIFGVGNSDLHFVVTGRSSSSSQGGSYATSADYERSQKRVRELEEKQDEMIERQSQMEEQIAQQAVREAQMMEKQSQIEAQLTEFMKQFRPPDAP